MYQAGTWPEQEPLRGKKFLYHGTNSLESCMVSPGSISQVYPWRLCANCRLMRMVGEEIHMR